MSTSEHDALRLPLAFKPVYMETVWGGQRLAAQRSDVPAGNIGESWDLADHPRGMSVVSDGAFAGKTLQELMQNYGAAIAGPAFADKPFPLLIKVIDAQDNLSVQVHPDNALAQEMGLGDAGKTECWLMIGDGGTLYQGTVPGVDKAAFEAAMEAKEVAKTLNRYDTKDGDFFFLPARTVHALGTGCLLLEVQQNCDITFRVDDWGRVGLDGKPRQLHIAESLQTIDFSADDNGPVQANPQDHPQGGSVRQLVQCEYFSVEERRCLHTGGGGNGQCCVITNIEGRGRIATGAGSITVEPLQTVLISACAGPWTITAEDESPQRFTVSVPHPPAS